MRDIGRPGAFLRAAEADQATLKTGLGLPVWVPGGKHYVLTLLSSTNTPIAHRFELWDVRPQRVGVAGHAELIDGFCEREGQLWPRQNPPVDPRTVAMWEGPIGHVLGTGLPHVQAGLAGLPAGYEQMIALPLYQDTVMGYVVAWYL